LLYCTSNGITRCCYGPLYRIMMSVRNLLGIKPSDEIFDHEDFIMYIRIMVQRPRRIVNISLTYRRQLLGDIIFFFQILCVFPRFTQRSENVQNNHIQTYCTRRFYSKVVFLLSKCRRKIKTFIPRTHKTYLCGNNQIRTTNKRKYQKNIHLFLVWTSSQHCTRIVHDFEFFLFSVTRD